MKIEKGMKFQAGRNPFVNQVSFFLSGKRLETFNRFWSQSLRKSGQFLWNAKKDDTAEAWESQSLRKSGQFLYHTEESIKGIASVAIPS